MNDLPWVIDIEALRCHLGGRDTLALGALRVRAGERVALIGPNGAGKSTLLRCLGGFVSPAEARLQVLGRPWPLPLQQPAERRRLRAEIGQVLQGLHLVGRLSALENVLLGALARVPAWRSSLRWFPPREVAQAQAALARVGLAHRARERSDRLSGGERQKVAIARMLLQRPRLILADEPTASLDPQAAADVCERLVEAAEATPGVTLITVVHNPALLPLLADRVIGLRAGRLAFDLPVEQVDDQRLARLYLSEPAPAAPAAAVPPLVPARGLP